MTAPRMVLPGHTYLVTRRCTQRQFWLRPDKKTTRIFLYCLAEAASRTGISVLAWIAMSNHYHAVIYDPDGRLPEFLEHFHKMLAKALNARWGRWENLWSSEQASAVYLVNPEDVLDKVVYVLANPVSSHLVDRVYDWPGATSLQYLDGTRELSIERPREFFSASARGRMPERVSLRAATPLGVEPEQWARRVREGVAAREEAARRERRDKGLPIVGRKQIRRALPSDRPSTYERRRDRIPKIACRDRNRRIHELSVLKNFQRQYAAARTRVLEGATDVVFPPGAYQWPRLRVRAIGRRGTTRGLGCPSLLPHSADSPCVPARTEIISALG